MKTCGICYGIGHTGTIVKVPCGTCKGTGKVSVNKRIRYSGPTPRILATCARCGSTETYAGGLCYQCAKSFGTWDVGCSK